MRFFIHCTAMHKDDLDFSVHLHRRWWRRSGRVYAIHNSQPLQHEVPSELLDDIFRDATSWIDVVARLRAHGLA